MYDLNDTVKNLQVINIQAHSYNRYDNKLPCQNNGKNDNYIQNNSQTDIYQVSE